MIILDYQPTSHVWRVIIDGKVKYVATGLDEARRLVKMHEALHTPQQEK